MGAEVSKGVGLLGLLTLFILLPLRLWESPFPPPPTDAAIIMMITNKTEPTTTNLLCVLIQATIFFKGLPLEVTESSSAKACWDRAVMLGKCLVAMLH